MAAGFGSMGLMAMADEAFTDFTQWVGGLFTPQDFSLEETLADIPSLDPLFQPQAPMSADNIDVHTLNELGKRGLKRGKLITAQTHPELYRAWEEESLRAGLAKPPQLILTESNIVNALTISPQEVAITTGLLKADNARDVMGILGHELGHAQSDHTTPRMIAMGALGGAGLMAGNYFGHWGGIGKLLDHTRANSNFIRRTAVALFDTGAKSSSWVATRVYMALGAGMGLVLANHLTVRPTELDADRKGAIISGDPEGMIGALQKLQQTEAHHPVRNFFSYLHSGYPSIETRIHHLRQTAATMPSQPLLPSTAPVTEMPKAAHTLATAQPSPQVSAVIPAETRLGTPVTLEHAAG